MTLLVTVCAFGDIALLVFVAHRLYRSRHEGASLRLRIFGALAAATLFGALLTGTYVVADEAFTTGVRPVVTRIAPKAFMVGSVLLWVSALAAADVGRRLSRPVEELTEAATRIAEGELSTGLPKGHGKEARRLARALASMRRELEGRPYAAAFLRDAWHDLKTPAAAIRATTELLADGALDDPEAAARFVENLRRSSEQLERTLADLVTLARYETATLEPEKVVAVGEALDFAIARVAPLAEAKGVHIDAHVEGHPGAPIAEAGPLRCDPKALERAFSNLLENAVAASPAGRVTASLSESPQAIVIDVCNEPAQVPRDVRDRLFERAATSRRGKGSGLGLAIARAACEAHGGRIRFVELGPPRVRVRVELPR